MDFPIERRANKGKSSGKGQATQFRSENEARELGKKGGQASGAARRRKKTMKAAAKKAPLAEVIQAAYEDRMERDGLEPTQANDGGRTFLVAYFTKS